MSHARLERLYGRRGLLILDWASAVVWPVSFAIGVLQSRGEDHGWITCYGGDLLCPLGLQWWFRRSVFVARERAMFWSSVVVGLGCFMWEFIQLGEWKGTVLAVADGTFDPVDLLVYTGALVIGWVGERCVRINARGGRQRNPSGSRPTRTVMLLLALVLAATSALYLWFRSDAGTITGPPAVAPAADPLASSLSVARESSLVVRSGERLVAPLSVPRSELSSTGPPPELPVDFVLRIATADGSPVPGARLDRFASHDDAARRAAPVAASVFSDGKGRAVVPALHGREVFTVTHDVAGTSGAFDEARLARGRGPDREIAVMLAPPVIVEGRVERWDGRPVPFAAIGCEAWSGSPLRGVLLFEPDILADGFGEYRLLRCARRHRTVGDVGRRAHTRRCRVAHARRGARAGARVVPGCRAALPRGLVDHGTGR